MTANLMGAKVAVDYLRDDDEVVLMDAARTVPMPTTAADLMRLGMEAARDDLEIHVSPHGFRVLSRLAREVTDGRPGEVL